jgi:hypothetical protein
MVVFGQLFNRKPVLVGEKLIAVGTKAVLEAPAPKGNFSVIFEDDGETGYMYALDRLKNEAPIIDALHIYDVGSVKDRHKPSNFQVVWTVGGDCAMLLINGYPHAVVDCRKLEACCRTGFPPPDPRMKRTTHDWSENMLSPFMKGKV